VVEKVWEQEEIEAVRLLVKTLQVLEVPLEVQKLQAELLFLCDF